MGDFPFLNEVQKVSAGLHTATFSHLLSCASGGTHTKGAYVELVASTAFPSCGLIIELGYADYPCSYLVDIAIGAAGSETVIIENLIYEKSGDLDRHRSSLVFYLPIDIPSATRISARTQGTYNAKVVGVGVHTLHGPYQQSLGLQVKTFGANTADSGGVSIDPGSSANTKGNYAQIDAAIAVGLRGIFIGFGGALNTGRTWGEWLVDIAVGGAGSEQIILPDIPIYTYSGAGSPNPGIFPFIPIRIPAGTRLAARAQSSITDATDRVFDIVVYGVV